MHETPCVDQRMLLVVINLERGSPIGMILVKTLNGLDAILREVATFFVESPSLLQV